MGAGFSGYVTGIAASFASGLLAAVIPAVTTAAQPSGVVRYVANAGVLVSVQGVTFLIDAPIRDGISPYATSSADERERLEAAEPPYDSIDAILVTHWHEDHFSAKAVAAHLSNNPRAVFVSSPEVAERLRAEAPALSDERLHAVLPAPGASVEVTVRGVPVRVLRIRHNPARRFPDQHVGFLVGERDALLHVGDADPKADNFDVLRNLPAVDVAFVPFWYLLNDANRRLVREVIRPGRVAAMHVPTMEAASARRAFAEAGVEVTLLAEPGTMVELTP